MKTHTITTYGIQELSDEAFRHAIDSNRDWNLQHDWWDYIYADAADIGLKITGFDLDRGAYCEGELTDSTKEVATNILREHGPTTDTYKLAEEFLKHWPAKTEEDGDERDSNFKETLCALYLKTLRLDRDYLSEEDAIAENMEANEAEFLEDGTLYTL